MDRSDIKVAGILLLIGGLALANILLWVIAIPNLGGGMVGGRESRLFQSMSYWRGEARPFAILEHVVAADNGSITLVLQNNDVTENLIITKLSVGTGSKDAKTSFAPGETRTMTVDYVTAGDQTAGALYYLAVNISYTTSKNVSATQYGTKSLIGEYS